MSKTKNTDGTIIEFLLGSHSYNGNWFMDEQNGRPHYWWRPILRAYLAAASPVSDAVEFAKFIATHECPAMEDYRADKIVLVDGDWYWSNDKDGDQPLSEEELYAMFKSTPPTPTNVQEQ